MTEIFEQAVSTILAKNVAPEIITGKAVRVTDDGFDLISDRGATLYDVRLVATASGSGSFVKVIPADNSYVAVALLEGSQTEAVLISTSEVDKIHVKVGTLEIKIRDNKVSIENDAVNLKAVLTGFITNLKTAIIQTPAGPGNFSPADVQKMDQTIQKIEQILM